MSESRGSLLADRILGGFVQIHLRQLSVQFGAVLLVAAVKPLVALLLAVPIE